MKTSTQIIREENENQVIKEENEIQIIREAIENGVAQTLVSFNILKVDSIEFGDIKANNEYKLKKGVFVMIGLIGNFPGRIVYRFSEQTAINIASKMMGCPIDDNSILNSISLSAIAEFVNISSGAAVRNSNTLAYELDITPPTTIRGEDMVVNIHQGAVYSFMNIRDVGKIDIFTSFSS